MELDEYCIEGFKVTLFESVYKYDNIHYKLKISRKWSIYFWKIGLYLLLLTLSSVGVFCMDDDSANNADKLGLLFTLLLTGVALQFVVEAWVPSLSYLTLLDNYIWYHCVGIYH